MSSEHSIQFFDRQFQRQVGEGDLQLNPFEQIALPHLRGRVLDLGCGLGNLALAAARRGCQVLALDSSPAAIAHLDSVARHEGLSLQAVQAELSGYEIRAPFDSIVSIGLLMFFDCPTARRLLRSIQAHVAVGGIAAVNLLVQGTTYMDMFERGRHCLLARDELAARFAGWELIEAQHQDFDAPSGTVKSFDTVVASRRGAGRTA
jgi:tellurite methyltransferase